MDLNKILADERKWKGWESELEVAKHLERLTSEALIDNFFWVSDIALLDSLKVDFILVIEKEQWLIPLQVKSSYGYLVVHKHSLIGQLDKIREMEGKIYIADQELYELKRKGEQLFIVEDGELKGLTEKMIVDLFYVKSLFGQVPEAEKGRFLFIIEGRLYCLTLDALTNIPVVVASDSPVKVRERLRNIIDDWQS